MSAPILVGRKEAADLTGLSLSEIKRAIGAGELRPKARGRRILIPYADLIRWADSLPDY